MLSINWSGVVVETWRLYDLVAPDEIAAGEDIIAPRWWRFASSARNLWPSCKVFSSAVKVWSCLVFRVPPKNVENWNITQVDAVWPDYESVVRLFKFLLCFVLFACSVHCFCRSFKSPSGAARLCGTVLWRDSCRLRWEICTTHW